MALYTFPMKLEDFFGGLPIQSFASDLGESMEHSRTAAGEVITADLGPRLWQNDITIRTGYYDEIERVKAKLQLLRQAGRSLLVHSMPFIAPQSDPDGSILGNNVISLTSVQSNNREISLSGFPAGYTLTVGDFLSFTYSNNPTRYAMHQIVQGGIADVVGTISNLEVVPFIRPGYTTGAQVRLMKPIYKAVLMPASTSAGKSRGQMTDGVQFSLIQTLR